jgi:uncharacterized protein (TIGR00730 family)
VKICFIGSGVEREDTRVIGIEVDSIACVVRRYYDTLIFGGSRVGLMAAFATAFTHCGGRVISVVPRWLEKEDLVYRDCEPIFCKDLAERKHLMFEQTDAVLCYPGGVGTWDELFDLLARRAAERGLNCPPIYIYNWEKYYAPLLLQMETAAELGLLHPKNLQRVRAFESADALAELLGNQHTEMELAAGKSSHIATLDSLPAGLLRQV